MAHVIVTDWCYRDRRILTISYGPYHRSRLTRISVDGDVDAALATLFVRHLRPVHLSCPYGHARTHASPGCDPRQRCSATLPHPALARAAACCPRHRARSVLCAFEVRVLCCIARTQTPPYLHSHLALRVTSSPLSRPLLRCLSARSRSVPCSSCDAVSPVAAYERDGDGPLVGAGAH